MRPPSSAVSGHWYMAGRRLAATRSMICARYRLSSGEARTLSACAPSGERAIDRRPNAILGVDYLNGKRDTTCPCGALQHLQLLGAGDGGVRQCRDAAGRRNQLQQDLLPLAVEFRRHDAYPGGIAAGMGERDNRLFRQKIVRERQD